MRTTLLLVVITLFLGARGSVVAADEAPAASPDVTSVFLWLGDSIRPGLWVSGHESGWSIPLPYVVADACTAKLHDISPGPVPLPKLNRSEHMAAHQATLSLPRPRYTGSQTYRISFRCGLSKVPDLLVHLDPSAEELASWVDAKPATLLGLTSR